MPAFGLDKAAAKAALKGVQKSVPEAKILRPGDEPVEAAAKRVAPKLNETTPEPKAPETPEQVVPETVQPADVDEAARRLSEAQLGDFSLDESFQTNFDTIATTDDIKAVIADVAEQNASRIDEARRGVITEAELRGLSDDLDINEDVVRSVMERETGGVLNAETILAARQVLNSSAERVRNLAVKITKGQANDIERLTFRRQLQWHSEFQTQFMGARAEAGRALNVFRIPTGANEIDISRVREFVESAAGHDTDTIAKAVALMDNTASISKAARKYTQSKLMGTVNELFINSILSGPKTHVVNTLGNVLMQTMNLAETAVAARIGRFLGGEDHVLVGEASAIVHGTISAWKDAFRLMARTARTGVPLDDVVKFEGSRRRSLSAEHLLTPEQRATPLGGFAEILLNGMRVGDVPVPGIGQVIRAPTERVMMPIDEFFKTLAYRGEIARQTYLHVHDQIASGAIRQADAARVAREFMENPPNNIVKLADDYTRYVTFQNPLGSRGQKFQLALRSTPVLSLLAPFVRTPVNLFVGGILDRSPIALFRAKFYEAMRAGGRERDMMLARVSMGSATSAIVASLAADGTITGAGPTDPEARALLEASGWQPYSIKVGDTYQSYARAEPLAYVIGATADATEVLSYVNSETDGMDDERQRANDVAAAIIIGIANNTMSKTYVQGIADFTEMMTDPKRYFGGWSRNMATALVPYASFRRQMGQLDDPYLREAQTVMESLRVNSGIPGWSEEAPPRRDVFGNPRSVYSGSLIGPMSPLPDRTVKVNPVLDEIIVLMEQTRTVPVTMPSRRVEGMRLESEEYDQLTVIARTRPHPATGRTFEEALAHMFARSAYINATPDMQVELVKDTQRQYDDMARIMLERENVVFATRLANYRRKRDELRFGESAQ